jgi:hypothetical protein
MVIDLLYMESAINYSADYKRFINNFSKTVTNIRFNLLIW